MLGEIIIMLSYFRVCSSLLAVALRATMTESSLWRKAILSTYTSRSQSVLERSQDRNQAGPIEKPSSLFTLAHA